MSQKNQGIICIIGAGFCFALMSFFVRISGDLPTMQKVFFRNLVAVFVAAYMVCKNRKEITLKSSRLPILALRCICGTAGLICNFFAIDHMNISDANMLNKLSPFFAIIFSWFILKEKANKIEWAAVVIAFTGALFVVKPSFSVEFGYAMIAVLGGISAGAAYTFVRKLGNMGENKAVIVLAFSLFSCLVTLPFTISVYEPMKLSQLLYLFLAGTAASGGQFLITAAYTKAAAKEISVFDYSQVVFAAILGLMFLGQIPDGFSIVGYIIIIGVAIAKWKYQMSLDK